MLGSGIIALKRNPMLLLSLVGALRSRLDAPRLTGRRRRGSRRHGRAGEQRRVDTSQIPT